MSAWGSRIERRMYSESATTVDPSSNSTSDPNRPFHVGATAVDSAVWQERQPMSAARSPPSCASPPLSPPQATRTAMASTAHLVVMVVMIISEDFDHANHGDIHSQRVGVLEL